METKYLNDDELISAINNSSEPYIIVEGLDDVMIYRWILDDINCTAMLEPRYGCGGVKKIFNRRREIKNPKVVFICDKDKIVYTNAIPDGYKEMIYTEGYSIENDLYQGKELERRLFDKDDRKLFDLALDSFLRYYACELEKFRSSVECDFTKKPESILNHNDYSLMITQLKDYKEPLTLTIDYLKKDYDLLLRGHSLFQLIGMILHRENRKIKYKTDTIYELCFKFCKSNSICHLQEKIKQRI